MTRPRGDEGDATTGPAVASDRRFAVLLVGVLAVEVAVVLGVPIFVTVDGAEHMGAAAGLVGAVAGHEPARTFLDLHLLPATNLLPLLPYAALGSLIGYPGAEKIVLASYVITLPLATWYALSGIRRDARWLTFVAVPLTFSFTFHYGLLSFSLGIVGFLAVAGYAARVSRTGRYSVRQVPVLGVLLLTTYMTHPVPYTQALLLLGATTLTAWLAEPSRTFGSLLRRAWPVALAAAPSLALMFSLLGGGVAVASDTESRNPVVLLGATLSLVWGMVTYDLGEAVLTGALALTLGAAGVLALRKRGARLVAADGYLLFAFLVVTELIVLREGTTLGSGGGFVSQRLALFPVYGGTLWLAASGLPQRTMRLIGIVAVGVAAGLLLLRLPSYVRLSDHASAYIGVEQCLGRGATMVQANLWLVDPGPLRRTDPLTNEAGRLSAPTGGWDLGNLDSSVALFPIRNRPANDPFYYLRDTGRSMQEIPPAMDPERFRLQTGESVDYVLVYGRANATESDLAGPRWLRLEAQLEKSYRLVATSSDHLLEVWELADGPAAARGATQRAALPPDACQLAAINSAP